MRLLGNEVGVVRVGWIEDWGGCWTIDALDIWIEVQLVCNSLICRDFLCELEPL